LGVHKVQAVFGAPLRTKKDFPDLKIESLRHSGALHTMIIQGDGEEIERRLAAYNPPYMELLPLTLEEVFLYETEVQGYDIKSLLLECIFCNKTSSVAFRFVVYYLYLYLSGSDSYEATKCS
jgi:ABC-2 type transport system ATP-binding protein